MVPVWLYSSDGRAMFCAYVQVPMPVSVTYGGLVFVWSATYQQYRQYTPVMVAEAAAKDRPPESDATTHPVAPH